MGGAVKREWIEAAQRERFENGAKAVARWDDEGGASVTSKKPCKHGLQVNVENCAPSKFGHSLSENSTLVGVPQV